MSRCGCGCECSVAGCGDGVAFEIAVPVREAGGECRLESRGLACYGHLGAVFRHVQSGETAGREVGIFRWEPGSGYRHRERLYGIEAGYASSAGECPNQSAFHYPLPGEKLRGVLAAMKPHSGGARSGAVRG